LFALRVPTAAPRWSPEEAAQHYMRKALGHHDSECRFLSVGCASSDSTVLGYFFRCHGDADGIAV